MTGAHGVVVANVRQSLSLAEGAHLHVELHPVGAVFLRVDVMVELVQFGVMLVNPGENLALVVATQVQVLQPDEVAAVLSLSDDGLDIGHGRDKVALLGVFLQFHNLMTGLGEDLHDAVHRLGGEGLLGG